MPAQAAHPPAAAGGTIPLLSTAPPAPAGATQGFFLGDSGLTCCHYDSVTAHVVLGTDRGMVHFLDASVLR